MEIEVIKCEAATGYEIVITKQKGNKILEIKVEPEPTINIKIEYLQRYDKIITTAMAERLKATGRGMILC